ncbi:MAG TPA: class I SAM-dependent methyltransferase [Trichormus sp.]
MTQNAALKKYVRRGHLLVEGWLHSGAIDLIVALDQCQKEQNVRGHVAEIGVHYGRLLILLSLLSRSEEKTLAVDVFGMQELNTDRSGYGDRWQFVFNMKRWADGEARLLIKEMDSSTLSAADVLECLQGSVRLFSVDGGHTPELTKHDLETAAGCLADGGIIILDDYFNEKWPGVSEGTAHFFGEHREVVPFAVGGNKVFLTTAAFAPVYREYLSKLDVGFRKEEKTMFSSPVIVVVFSKSAPSVREQLKKSAVWRGLKKGAIGKMIQSAVRIADRAWSES